MARKLAFGSAAVVVLLVVAVALFYRSIHNGEWELRAAAESTVTSATYMRTIDRIESFVGDKPYMIAFGQDADGREAIAWVDGDQAHLEYTDAGISEEEVRQKVMSLNADNDVLRILPGVLNGTYVWEALYKRKDESGDRYYYGYYRFDDGSEIDTWRMSKRVR